MLGGGGAGIVEFAGERFIQCVNQQGGFAATGNACHAGERAERNFSINIFKVVAARVFHCDALVGFCGAALFRHRHLFGASQILPGQTFFGGDNLRRRALRYNFATMQASARADIDHMVGGHNRLLIVLYNDDSIAEVAQSDQRVQ